MGERVKRTTKAGDGFVVLKRDRQGFFPWDRLGYVQWHDRAEQEASRGVKQTLCATCERWRWPDERHCETTG